MCWLHYIRSLRKCLPLLTITLCLHSHKVSVKAKCVCVCVYGAVCFSLLFFPFKFRSFLSFSVQFLIASIFGLTVKDTNNACMLVSALNCGRNAYPLSVLSLSLAFFSLMLGHQIFDIVYSLIFSTMNRARNVYTFSWSSLCVCSCQIVHFFLCCSSLQYAYFFFLSSLFFIVAKIFVQTYFFVSLSYTLSLSPFASHRILFGLSVTIKVFL